MKPHLTIYTDGGCSPNPGPGSWGVILIPDNGDQEEFGGAETNTTNNRMELTAVIEALRSYQNPCAIDLYTDSQYVKLGITEWIKKWAANGWRTADKKPVKNQDLWKRLWHESKIHDVTWHWVKGHAGNSWNERADQIVREARAEIEGSATKWSDGISVQKKVRLVEVGYLIINNHEFKASEVYDALYHLKDADGFSSYALIDNYDLELLLLGLDVAFKLARGGLRRSSRFDEFCQLLSCDTEF